MAEEVTLVEGLVDAEGVDNAPGEVFFLNSLCPLMVLVIGGDSDLTSY